MAAILGASAAAVGGVSEVEWGAALTIAPDH